MSRILDEPRLGLLVLEQVSSRRLPANPALVKSLRSDQNSRLTSSETSSFGACECILASQGRGFGSWDADIREFEQNSWNLGILQS